jgi:regulator of protease activity HflC (stomatin/prohibitin superfamily)
MYFGIAIALGIIFIIGLLVAIFSTPDRRGDNYGRTGGAGVAVAALIILAIVTALFSATTVDQRAVGIQTSFGKYTDTLDNGFHWTAPWSNVEQFSTQLQELKVDVPVSFDGGSSGTAHVTTLWAIDGPRAEALWKDFKTFDRVSDLLVEPSNKTAIAAAFSAYQPQDARDGRNRAAIQDAVRLALSGEKNNGGAFEGRGILVDTVQVTGVELDPSAQDSVNRVAEAASNTKRAQEEQERAKIEAETATIRAQSQTPESLQRYCLEVMNSWNVDKNGPLPATFNCLSGSTTSVQPVVPVN